jgi:hypothetical protein
MHHKNILKLRHLDTKGRFGWTAAVQIFKKICQFAELNKFLLFDLCLIAYLWAGGCQMVQNDKDEKSNINHIQGMCFRQFVHLCAEESSLLSSSEGIMNGFL